MMKILNKPIVKILVSIILFGAILWQIDFTLVIDNFKQMDLKFIPLILGLLIANYIISSVRWKKLMLVDFIAIKIFKNKSQVICFYIIIIQISLVTYLNKGM